MGSPVAVFCSGPIDGRRDVLESLVRAEGKWTGQRCWLVHGTRDPHVAMTTIPVSDGDPWSASLPSVVVRSIGGRCELGGETILVRVGYADHPDPAGSGPTPPPQTLGVVRTEVEATSSSVAVREDINGEPIPGDEPSVSVLAGSLAFVTYSYATPAQAAALLAARIALGASAVVNLGDLPLPRFLGGETGIVLPDRRGLLADMSFRLVDAAEGVCETAVRFLYRGPFSDGVSGWRIPWTRTASDGSVTTGRSQYYPEVAIPNLWIPPS